MPNRVRTDEPSILAMLVAYFAVLIFVAGVAVLVERRLGFSAYRGASIGLGVALILASLRAPPILYYSVRYVRIMAFIEDDTAARVLLAIFGVTLTALGVFADGIQ